MKKLSTLVLETIGAIALVFCAQGAGQTGTAKIIVGPDIMVSRDGNFPHIELMIATNPRDSRNLVAGSITASGPEGGLATTAYASVDTGYTWTPHSLPGQLVTGGGDPQVGFTVAGTALFANLAKIADVLGKSRAALQVYRSEDGGHTWNKPVNLGFSYDHEMLVVDRSVGKFAGRIYIAAMWGYPIYRVGVFRSDDDGRTFIGPVEAANGGGNVGINVVNTLVLSDGTLFVPYVDFEFKSERQVFPHHSGIWFVASTDGAVTFSAPKKIATFVFTKDAPMDRFQYFPTFAVDNRSERYRDRIYSAWNDMSAGHPQIAFTYSSDRGNTWSKPTHIGSPASQAADQFQVSLAVNSDGTLAVTWYDTQGFPDHSAIYEYFTASVDGGETFLPEVRVSSAPSRLFGEGNMLLAPKNSWTEGSWRVNLTSVAGRWGNGGDYMGLCADERGVFHPLWADARTGTYQMWTAAVRIEQPPVPPRAGVALSPSVPIAESRQNGSVDRLVEIVYDPPRYDPANHTFDLPIRLKNVSQTCIYPPLVIKVVKFGSAQDNDPNASQILNSDNQKQGDGAMFDYTRALRDLQELEPGAVSGAVVWKMKLVDPLKPPTIQFGVTGSFEK